MFYQLKELSNKKQTFRHKKASIWLKIEALLSLTLRRLLKQLRRLLGVIYLAAQSICSYG